MLITLERLAVRLEELTTLHQQTVAQANALAGAIDQVKRFTEELKASPLTSELEKK